MAKIDDIKGAVMDTIGSVAGKTRDLAGNVADKAKDVSRIAKLNIEISTEKDTIKKAYIEIGKLYYETHKDDPDGFFVQLCDEITVATESIKSKEAEIAEIKAATQEGEPDVVVEFENVVADAEEEAEGEDTDSDDGVTVELDISRDE
jgi:predicted  nucleic acid-binding Zn-ribbon protein